MKTQAELNRMSMDYYAPSNSTEYYDYKTGNFYNHSGQELRDVGDYDAFSEGYTPFGDE